jgi:hypothetical protein
MSKDFEDYLVKHSAPYLLIHSKHRATDVVQFIIAKVYVWHKKKPFNFYLKFICFLIYFSDFKMEEKLSILFEGGTWNQEVYHS